MKISKIEPDQQILCLLLPLFQSSQKFRGSEWSPTVKQSSKVTDLHRAVRCEGGERTVHRELAKCPWVIKELVEGCCNLCWVVSHFELGNEAEIDFVVLHGFSGGWDVHLIELEPPSMAPLKNSGDYAPRLNHAVGQLRRWKSFQNQRDKLPYLTTQLERAAKKRDLLYHDGREVIDSQCRPITDSSSWLRFHYYVVMGQRCHFSPDQMCLKAGMSETDGSELITYDRVLDVYEKQLASPSFGQIYHRLDQS